jgi:hypothetical protein
MAKKEKQSDPAADFIGRCFALLDHEDSFGYSLQEGKTKSHGEVRKVNLHTLRLSTDEGDVIIVARPSLTEHEEAK